MQTSIDLHRTVAWCRTRSTPDTVVSRRPVGRTFVSRFGSWVLLLLVMSVSAHQQVRAQSGNDFSVEVQVADQGDSERRSAYWLAFDRVMRRQVETRVRIEPAQREELMKDPSLYVQSFRYRRYNPVEDITNLATRSVREGALPGAVITVAFRTDLAAVIQQQLIPVVEEQEVPTVAPTIALIAVEQQGTQFIIGGARGGKFQARALQLAAANNLQLQFPEFTPEDLELISAADIFASDVGRINNFAARFPGSEVLTGALYRLSPTVWQSDWSYTGQDLQRQSFSLSTATLDEALVSVMTQVSAGGSDTGGGFLSSGYNEGGAGSLERVGMVVRVENIRSLADYDNVLAFLRQLDGGVITETLDVGSIVFRASEQGAARVQNSLLASADFEAVNTDQFAGELSFRYLAR